MEDSSLRLLWRLTKMLVKIGNGAAHKKMLKMKVAPQSFLKTKGQKSAPQELMKIKELR
jgi:hypothetical protein